MMEFLNYMALVKHNNNSISAVTSMASLTTGDMTLIKEQTASSSASISFVDGSSDVVLDSTYPIYKFEFINIHSQNDVVQFYFNGSTDGGSNYNVTKTTTHFRAFHNEADSSAGLQYENAADLAQSTSGQTLFRNQGNDTDNSGSGYLYLFAPSSSTYVKHFLSTIQDSNATVNPGSYNGYIGGYFNTTSPINAVNFLFDSGNIDSGTIKLYGIKDS